MSQYKRKPQYKSLKEKEIMITPNIRWLIIVESPSKCSKIESFLGSEYRCIASKGHINTIDNLKSINITGDFETKFDVIPEKKTHIESMQKIVSQFPKENIMIATDDDREGEAIAWHLCNLFGLDITTTKRIIFREITKSAILYAVEHPSVINLPLVQAQNCRQILDIIVGYKISPILWKHVYFNKANSLSAGRCQTPALRLVYDKAMSISNKETLQLYQTTASFFQKEMLFELNKEFERKGDIEDFLSESIEFSYRLKIESPQLKKSISPKPFNTSCLLQKISTQLHYSPKEAMSLCQQLYQDGHITYMRTDSTKYSIPFLSESKSYIAEKYGEKYVGNLSNIQNTDNTNPHEAIRVTHIELSNISSSNLKLNSLYKLIWQNTVESCMSEYEYISYMITISAPKNTIYKHMVEVPTTIGWKIIQNKHIENDNSLVFYLQTIERTQKFTYNYIKSTVSVKNGERHYTEAGLIKELEEKGIGRPSTFSGIIDTIQERGYVKKQNIEGTKYSVTDFQLIGNEINKTDIEKVFGNEKNKLVIQNIGIIVCEFLIEYFSELFSYDYTKNLEIELDEIANNARIPWYETCRNCINNIDSLISSLNIHKKEYKIDDENILVYGKNGPVIKNTGNGSKKINYISVKHDLEIDIEKLKGQQYTLEELMEVKERELGKYKNAKVLLKSGKFGYYIELHDEEERNTKRQSVESFLKTYNKTADELSIDDILEMIESSTTNVAAVTSETNIMRELSKNISIRKGKYGAYIYYKTSSMKKPEFYNVQKFKGFTTCSSDTLLEWIYKTYNISDKS
jgi:DNA topoisomerase-1